MYRRWKGDVFVFASLIYDLKTAGKSKLVGWSMWHGVNPFSSISKLDPKTDGRVFFLLYF